MPSSAQTICVPPEQSLDDNSSRKIHHPERNPEGFHAEEGSGVKNVVEHAAEKNDSSSNSFVENTKIEIGETKPLPYSIEDNIGTPVESEDIQNTSNGSNETSDRSLDKLDVAARFAVDPNRRRNSKNYENEEFLYYSKPPAQRLFDRIAGMCRNETSSDAADPDKDKDEEKEVENKTVTYQLQNPGRKEQASSDDEEIDILTTSSEISMQVQNGSTKNSEDIGEDEMFLLGKIVQNQADLDEEGLFAADENQETGIVERNLPKVEVLHTENYKSELSIFVNDNSSVGGKTQTEDDDSRNKLQNFKIQNWIDNCDKTKHASKDNQFIKDIAVALARLKPSVPSMADMAELIDMTEAIELNMVCEEKKNANQGITFRPDIVIFSGRDDDTPETPDSAEDYPEQPYWDDELEEEMAKLYATSRRNASSDDDCPDLGYPTPPNEGAGNEREEFPQNAELEEIRRIIHYKLSNGPANDDDIRSLEGSVSDEEIPEISCHALENPISSRNKKMPQESDKNLKATSTSVEQPRLGEEEEEIIRRMSFSAFNFSATEMEIIKTKMGKLSTIIDRMKEVGPMKKVSVNDHELNLSPKSNTLGAIGEDVLDSLEIGAAAASAPDDPFGILTPVEVIPHQAVDVRNAKIFLACNKKSIISRMLVGEDHVLKNNDVAPPSRIPDDDLPALEDVSCPVPSASKNAGRGMKQDARGTNTSSEELSPDRPEMVGSCESVNEMTTEEVVELGRRTGAIPRKMATS